TPTRKVHRIKASVGKASLQDPPLRKPSARKPQSLAERQAEKRDAILNAALDEFAASGFAAARLDDVARRAGVAKGTIYLYFRDKESLFQELVRTMLTPLIERIEAAGAADLPARVIARTLAAPFVNQ